MRAKKSGAAREDGPKDRALGANPGKAKSTKAEAAKMASKAAGQKSAAESRVAVKGESGKVRKSEKGKNVELPTAKAKRRVGRATNARTSEGTPPDARTPKETPALPVQPAVTPSIPEAAPSVVRSKPRRKTGTKPVTPVTHFVPTVTNEPSALPSKPAVVHETAARPVAPEPAVHTQPPQPTPSPQSFSLKIPSILLEGDEPSPVTAEGPGRKYALGPGAPATQPHAPERELPQDYGTQRLMMIARDSHWLYAYWDFSHEQQYRYNALSADQHLILRVYRDKIGHKPADELHVHPESRHWFVHVERAGTKYLGELGYYGAKGDWVALAVSGIVATPPDTASSDLSVEFATMVPETPKQTAPTSVAEKPADVPASGGISSERRILESEHFQPRLGISAGWENLEGRRSLAPTVEGISTPVQPQPPMELAPVWTSEQERALAEVLVTEEVWVEAIDSAEVSRMVRRQTEREIEVSSMAAAQFGVGGPLNAELGISSPLGGEFEALSSPAGGEQPRGFWFKINAEIIIYGATEPDATVTIGGRPIKLRPDGTFSYRYALPDGQYTMPVAAISTHNDVRRAGLEFRRSTEYRGEVGKHPQDETLTTMKKNEE